MAGWLETRLAVEAELGEARRRLEAQDAELEASEQGRSRCERQAEAQRRQIEEQRLALGEARVKQQNLRDQLQELERYPGNGVADAAGSSGRERLAGAAGTGGAAHPAAGGD